jgi:flagellar basal-body rod protein FlgC
MVDAVSIALTGLAAQGVRLAVSANNIANADMIGVLPTAEAPASTVYRPLDVSYAALTAGAGNAAGVRAYVTQDPNGYSPAYDPSSIYANSAGVVAAPNVDLLRESVNILESRTLYKANLAVIKTERDMVGELLNTVS